MVISPAQWLLAFVGAVAIHLLAGTMLLLAENPPQVPEQLPRGVFVSLDSLTVGGPQLSQTPQPVTPATESLPQPKPAPTPQVPTTAAAVAAPSATTPVLATPQPVAPPQPATVDAPSPAQSVRLPVANAVTIEAADTLQALEQATALPAAPSAPATAQLGSGAGGTSEQRTESYITRIIGWIGRHKYYPQGARSSGAQGTVRLHLVVDRSGQVRVAIAESSGSPALDQAAIDMVKRSLPLPAMTKDMLRTRLEIILPVDYTLGTPSADTAPSTR